MPDDRTILLDRQCRVFRIACDPRRYGLTLGIIQADSGLGYDSLRHYASGETAMPLAAFNALIGVLPDELLSLLLPEDRVLCKLPEENDHAAHANNCVAFMGEYTAARDPASECGVDIGPVENKRLKARRAA